MTMIEPIKWVALLALGAILSPIVYKLLRGKRIIKATTRRLVSGKVVAQDLVSEHFSGRVELLTDSLLQAPANLERKRQYYSGAPLKWDIIAGQADIRHDLEATVVRQNLCDIPKSLLFVAILGESGAGKSTLAWRLAAQLHSDRDYLVLRVLDPEDANVWYRLDEFAYEVNEPFCILADDLFRNPDVVRALSELRPDLPIIVLATSQTHEYKAPRLAVDPVVVRLERPSSAERQKALDLLSIKPGDLTGEQMKRMETATDLWVLMAELTAGERLDESISGSLRFLQQSNTSIYRAYEYLCFAYSLGVAIPTSVMERLDPKGGFDDLPNQPGAEGLIFYQEGNSSLIRPGHQRRAQAARKLYEKSRSCGRVLQELIGALDPACAEHRRCLSLLVRGLLRRAEGIPKHTWSDIERSMREAVEQVDSISEMNEWRRNWVLMDRQEEATHCLNRCLRKEPRTSHECETVAVLLRQNGRGSDALNVTRKWLIEHPEDLTVRAVHLKLLARHGPDSEKFREINEIEEWLVQNDHDVRLRTAYVKFVENVGSAEQLTKMIDKAQEWLARHPNAGDFITVLLPAIERAGTPQQRARAVSDALRALAVDGDRNDVRNGRFLFSERVGTDQQVREALEMTEKWLRAHEGDSNVRTSFISVVDRRGTPDQVRRVIQEQLEWLKRNPSSTDVRTTILALIERVGTDQQTREVLGETEIWLRSGNATTDVRTSYLNVVDRRGEEDELRRVIQEQMEWLKGNPRATDVGIRMIALLKRRDRTQEAAKLAEWLLSVNPKNGVIAQHLVDLTLGSVDDMSMARRKFDEILHSADTQGLRLAWARWLEARGFDKEAEEVYVALMPREIASKAFNLSYAYGRFLLARNRFEEARRQFRRVIQLHKGHQMAHHGLGQSLMGLVRGPHSHGDTPLRKAMSSEDRRMWSEAEQELQSAVFWASKQERDTGPLHCALGWYYLESSRYTEAHETFLKAIGNGSKTFEMLWGLGFALARLGRWPAALQALNEAVSAAPHPLLPPASVVIPRLIKQCEVQMTRH